MSSPVPLGPANTAHWENEAIGGESAFPQWLLLLPDAGSTDGAAIFYTLPRLPRIARTHDDDPLFELTLILSRMPEAGEPLTALVERGQLTFTLDLSAAPDTLRRLEEKRRRAGRLGDSFRPLFARSILATLDDSPRTIASSSGIGADAQIAFSASLDRAQTLAVLDALDGTPGALRVLLDISYRAASADSPRALIEGGSDSGVEADHSTETLRTLTLEAPLHALLGDLLSGGKWDRFVRLVARSDIDGAPHDVLVRLHNDPAITNNAASSSADGVALRKAEISL